MTVKAVDVAPIGIATVLFPSSISNIKAPSSSTLTLTPSLSGTEACLDRVKIRSLPSTASDVSALMLTTGLVRDTIMV